MAGEDTVAKLRSNAPDDAVATRLVTAAQSSRHTRRPARSRGEDTRRQITASTIADNAHDGGVLDLRRDTQRHDQGPA